MHTKLKLVCTLSLAAWVSSANAADQDLVIYVPEISSTAAQRLVEACVAIADEDDVLCVPKSRFRRKRPVSVGLVGSAHAARRSCIRQMRCSEAKSDAQIRPVSG